MVTPGQSKIVGLERIREVYIEKSILMGLVKTEEILESGSLGKKIYIELASDIDRVYVNGKQIKFK